MSACALADCHFPTLQIRLCLANGFELAATRNDVNNLGGSGGRIVQAPSDADASAIPEGDIQTALLYGQRVARIAARLKAAG